ncbi:hypothetical protein L1887_50221 [Cichorium endivia]|nr:hypothetical protein L1887_50221 [Cichorium endivia]
MPGASLVKHYLSLAWCLSNRAVSGKAARAWDHRCCAERHGCAPCYPMLVDRCTGPKSRPAWLTPECAPWFSHRSSPGRLTEIQSSPLWWVAGSRRTHMKSRRAQRHEARHILRLLILGEKRRQGRTGVARMQIKAR